MAKNIFIGIDNVARKARQPFVGVDGVARKVIGGCLGIDNVARKFFPGGTPLELLDIGTSVYMNVDDTPREFIVVHIGLPSTAYDNSCGGVWLLMKDIYTEMKWDSSNNDYANSDVHSYLNNTFVNLFDSSIKNKIKQAKIPYTRGTGQNGSVYSGSNGLSAKVFLLSFIELGYSISISYANTEGAVLDYFSGASDSERIAYLNGTAEYWSLRSPINGGYYPTTNAHGVSNTGVRSNVQVTSLSGVRPALILPYSTAVDESFNIIA